MIFLNHYKRHIIKIAIPEKKQHNYFYKIQHRKSSAYRLQMNSVVEVANKNVKRIIKRIAKNFKDWPHICHLPYKNIAHQFSHPQ